MSIEGLAAKRIALKTALGTRAGRLLEAQYDALITAQYDTPEALLDASEGNLKEVLKPALGAVDAVLAWQRETKQGAGGAAGGSAGKPMVIRFHKGKAEPKGGKAENRVSKDTKAATFVTTPSWSELCKQVEGIFPDMAAEAYSLLHDSMDLSEELWPEAVLPKKPPAGRIHLSLIVLSKCKPFSSFKREDTWQLLQTRLQQVHEDEECFHMADYEPEAVLDQELQRVLPVERQRDIISLVGQELALRCYKTDPRKHCKEVSKRQMISPVLYTAAALAGEGVSVDEERSICGAYGKGNIEFTIQFEGFDIVVLEGKLHETLDDHLGQLAAEMRAAREQYTRTYLCKRKFDDEDGFAQVPSFGILSNGTTYSFYKYNAKDKYLVQFTERAQLDKGITADAASEAVLPVIRRLLNVIKEQIDSMQEFKRPKHDRS